MWKDSYLVGVEKIDTQHKLLFEYVDILTETLKKDLKVADYRRQIAEAVRYLKFYCIEHFRDEEAYHLEISYAEHKTHKEMHKKLIQDVLAHEEALVSSNYASGAVRGFLGFVMTWLVYHVAGEDQKLRKITQAEPKAVMSAIEAFADKTREVLKTITGISDEDIKFAFKPSGEISDGISYKVGFCGGGDKKGVGVVFSNRIAIGALKAMAGMDIDEINEIAFSALQEISNITAARISDVISEDGEFCDIEHPIRVENGDFPKDADSFLISTTLGDMEVIVY